jgi:hypothetical protein
MNWRRFRTLKAGAASLALLPLCGSPIAHARDVSRPATSPPIVIACALCGTHWQAPPLKAAPTFASSAAAQGKRAPSSSDTGSTTAEAPRRLDGLRELAFRDNAPLVNRLKRIQAVAFLTVWDSASATLYVGVNRDGEPGLHLRQKKYDRGTLAPVNRTLFSDISPWRAARLAGQPARR